MLISRALDYQDCLSLIVDIGYIRTDKSIVLYEYQTGRGVKYPKEFLAGYKGYHHTDGYAGYHDLGENITSLECCDRMPNQIICSGSETILRAGAFYTLLESTLTVNGSLNSFRLI